MPELSSAQITHPAESENTDGQAHYVSLAAQTSDLLGLLAEQPTIYRELVAGLSEEAAGKRPAPSEWSVKEVLGHVNDAERVFAYRCVALARGETQRLPSFGQDAYVEQGHFNARTVASLVDEFDLQRRANLLAISTFTPDTLAIVGSINTYRQSVRALIYVMAGHAQHHIVSFQTDYGLS
jgi:hypothetical protein